MLPVGISVSAAASFMVCLAKTEIEKFCLSAIGYKNIGRLDVAMNDSFGMSRIQCIGNFDGKIHHFIDLHRLSANRVLEGFSFHHLHRDERTPFVFADFVDRADVRMVECRMPIALHAGIVPAPRDLPRLHPAGTLMQHDV